VLLLASALAPVCNGGDRRLSDAACFDGSTGAKWARSEQRTTYGTAASMYSSRLGVGPWGWPPCSLGLSTTTAVLFSQNKPATSNQPAVLFSQNKPAPATSHQPNEHDGDPQPAGAAPPCVGENQGRLCVGENRWPGRHIWLGAPCSHRVHAEWRQRAVNVRDGQKLGATGSSFSRPVESCSLQSRASVTDQLWFSATDG
jgi:hypothetical protein